MPIDSLQRRVHPAIASFAKADGQLVVGGVRVEQLAQRVGSTPFFAYDRRLLTARLDYLRRSLPDGVDISYAVKANPMPAVVQHVSALVDSLDVASAIEMKTALDTPIQPSRVSFAGPGKVVAELAQAVAAGITIEIESETELRRIISLGEQQGTRPRIAVRVNPDFEVKGSGMRLGGGSQQFGIDAECVPALLREIADAGVEFLGFHIFAGSQNLRTDSLCEAQQKTVALAVRLAETTTMPIRYLNVGGGFGIPYFERDEPVDLPAIGANLASLLDRTIRPRLGAPRVVVELGRYIVGECGVYVTRVVDRKVSRGKTFLVVDGGMHHQLAASGNFGQVIRRNYPVALASQMDGGPAGKVNVVGCLCTPLDLLADQIELPDARIGDLIAVFQAGAYGLTASPTAFLGHPAPIEILV